MSFVLQNQQLCSKFREKKLEKLRDDLWRRMDAIELAHTNGTLNGPPRVLEVSIPVLRQSITLQLQATPMTHMTKDTAHVKDAAPIEGTSPGNKSPKSKKSTKKS